VRQSLPCNIRELPLLNTVARGVILSNDGVFDRHLSKAASRLNPDFKPHPRETVRREISGCFQRGQLEARRSARRQADETWPEAAPLWLQMKRLGISHQQTIRRLSENSTCICAPAIFASIKWAKTQSLDELNVHVSGRHFSSAVAQRPDPDLGPHGRKTARRVIQGRCHRVNELVGAPANVHL